ncbi:response regulator [Pedomonas mirosovicensis]|uniref:response regulator n=1 Tax=Pedomonas mirosovicensis TaxID=2908641 RepID=UPI0021673D70|nr:response regulator [Pedomonas mirosovicensis]MCH8685485.1 response regulator [Pedomonas mirosovicensis]
MALDLQRLSVLVVEDSPFIRSLLIQSLKVLGVGQVLSAEHGGRAIELIQQVHQDPVRAGAMSVDLILSNWQMSPVDGAMLLRWVRRHKDSPDRFVPFLMVTAYSDRARVEEARNLGAHDVLTKPFTIRALGEKLTSIINKNRQFVHTKDYFGPDRRRQSLPFDGPDRRVLTDKSPEVEVIHG